MANFGDYFGNFGRLDGPGNLESWSRMARELDGAYDGSRIQAPLGESSVTVDSRQIVVWDSVGPNLLGYKQLATFTRLRVAAPNDGFCFRLNSIPYHHLHYLRENLGISGYDDFLYHLGLAPGVWARVAVGDQFLDGAFRIDSNDAARAGVLLTQLTIRTSLPRKEKACYQLAANELAYVQRGLITDSLQLRAVFHLFAETLGQLPPLSGGSRPLPATPEAETAAGCFFCGKPVRAGEAQAVSLALVGQPLRALVCERHAAALAAGEQPAVRARLRAGRSVPWFQDPTFNPAWDFDPGAGEPAIGWDALPAPAALFDPAPHAIVHVDDPRWTEP